jgi:hypothetical protein
MDFLQPVFFLSVGRNPKLLVYRLFEHFSDTAQKRI